MGLRTSSLYRQVRKPQSHRHRKPTDVKQRDEGCPFRVLLPSPGGLWRNGRLNSDLGSALSDLRNLTGRKSLIEGYSRCSLEARSLQRCRAVARELPEVEGLRPDLGQKEKFSFLCDQAKKSAGLPGSLLPSELSPHPLLLSLACCPRFMGCPLSERVTRLRAQVAERAWHSCRHDPTNVADIFGGRT